VSVLGCEIGDGRFRWAPRGGAQQRYGVARNLPSHTPGKGPTRFSTTNSNGTIANDTYGFDATDVAGMGAVGTTGLAAVGTTGLGAIEAVDMSSMVFYSTAPTVTSCAPYTAPRARQNLDA